MECSGLALASHHGRGIAAPEPVAGDKQVITRDSTPSQISQEKQL